MMLQAVDLRHNLYAFCLAVMKGYTPEQAFDYLESETPRQKRQNLTITVEDVREMIRLKEHMTYEQIGKIYGLTKYAVYNRIRHARGYRYGGDRP